MTRWSRTLFFVCAFIYTFGFALAEYLLQKYGVSKSFIALVACSHNFISTLLCAYIFWRFGNGFTKYLWSVGFLLDGVADVGHALTMFVFVAPENPVYGVVRFFYSAFAVLICIAFYKDSEVKANSLERLCIFLVSSFYASILILQVNMPMIEAGRLWYVIAQDISWNITSCFLISLMAIRGLLVRSVSGVLICFCFMFIQFSGVAISFYHVHDAPPALTLFNYSWELGFSMMAVIFLLNCLDGSGLKKLFRSFPYNSIRFQTSGLSISILFVSAIFLLVLASSKGGVGVLDVTVYLMTFLICWMLANVGSLWISRRFSTIRLSIEEENFSATLPVEVQTLLRLYQEKNHLINKGLSALKQQKECVENMFRHIAHDIRSPVAVLKAYVQSPDADDEWKMAAVRSTEKIDRMADDLIDYAKACQLTKKSIPLSRYVKDELFPEIENVAHKGISLRVSVSPEMRAHIDPYKFGRVLVNLMRNACEAISQHAGTGTVLIEAFQAGEQALALRVKDNGRGIPQDDLPRVFDSFFTKGKKNGTGLGLAYCKQVVEAHGGTIEVESEVGKGTTFTIRIPNCIVDDPAALPAMQKTSTQAGAEHCVGGHDEKPAAACERSLNLIIADDDSDMLSDLARKAKAQGATIAYQANAAEQIMADGSIDYTSIQAAIVDFEYKGSCLNGIDLIRHLKSMGVTDVHLCTGHYDDPEVRRQAREAGAATVLKKPLDEDELAKIL